jgi:hypothetical protein
MLPRPDGRSGERGAARSHCRSVSLAFFPIACFLLSRFVQADHRNTTHEGWTQAGRATTDRPTVPLGCFEPLENIWVKHPGSIGARGSIDGTVGIRDGDGAERNWNGDTGRRRRGTKEPSVSRAAALDLPSLLPSVRLLRLPSATVLQWLLQRSSAGFARPGAPVKVLGSSPPENRQGAADARPAGRRPYRPSIGEAAPHEPFDDS